MVSEQDQAIQVEMLLRGEDLCRYCGRVMPLHCLELASVDREKATWVTDAGQEGLALMCGMGYLDACIKARIERDERTAS